MPRRGQRTPAPLGGQRGRGVATEGGTRCARCLCPQTAAAAAAASSGASGPRHPTPDAPSERLGATETVGGGGEAATDAPLTRASPPSSRRSVKYTSRALARQGASRHVMRPGPMQPVLQRTCRPATQPRLVFSPL